ncbi:MAG TPA: ABC transporter ATP-binding protein [Candidatus Binatia bacterium]|nr:ABC transporter ATP-binding protein [Candidatus Binatia bacterium]
MRFLITIARMYPGRSALTLVSLLFASAAEGLSLLFLLPLLNLVTSDDARFAGNGLSGLGHMLTEALSAIGVTPTVGALLAVILVCLLLKGVFLLLANLQVGYTVAHVATDLRLSLLRSLLAARWEFYVRQPVGSLTNAIGTEAIRASWAYVQGAKTLVVLIQTIVFVGVAFFITWKGALLSLTVGGMVLYGLRQLVRIAHHAGTRQTQLLKSLLTRLADSLQSVKPLKAMAREELVGSLLGSENRRLNRALRRNVISTEALSAAQDLAVGLIITAGLYVALIQWKLPFNAVLVMVLVLARSLASLGKTQRQYQKMRSDESAFWSLQSVIEDSSRARETNPGGTSPRLEKSVRLNNVNFGYGKIVVLENASLTIPAGSFTAIMGPSGAGKTTIADLFIGLLRPQHGQVLIDNVPLEQVDLRQWRRMIGYVPQEPFLLHDTVLWNVTLGDPEVNKADVEAALRAAGAWEFVAELPQQIHSSVAERGTALSGGQRQRIAIARALARRPKLLILDEFTSSLDPQTEAEICRTLQGLRGQLTILAISHQPAVVEGADRIYRIQNGEAILVRDGRHLDLLSGQLQDEPKFA